MSKEPKSPDCQGEPKVRTFTECLRLNANTPENWTDPLFSGMFKDSILEAADLIDRLTAELKQEKQLAKANLRLAKGLAGELDRLTAELKAKDGEREKPCEWKEDTWEDGVYETTCNNLHQFSCDGIKENKYKFCPYCGQPIKEAK